MLVAVPPPPPPVVYVDPAGDSGTAPDITKVTVTNRAGRLSFVVVFRTPYGPSSNLYVLIGADGYRLAPYGLEVWDPPAQDYEPTGDQDTAFSVAPGGLALQTSVSLADLGTPKSFTFTVQSIDGDGGAGHMDTLVGVWPKPKLVVTSSRQSTAKAGGTWTTELRVAGAKTVTCKGAKPLTVAHDSVAAGEAVCVFRVPKTAKHKKLTAAVTVSVAGRSATKTFTTTAK